MRLSKRGEYALRALIALGTAQRQGRAMLQIPELARREKLPIKFLEQILVDLKSHGYVGSKRGKHGGYFLRQPMEAIKIGTVVRQLEGPLAPISCVSVTAYEHCSCPDEEHCALRMLMLGVRNAIAEILDRHTLAQTVDAALEKSRQDKMPLPFGLGED
jgi:Rrf2 family protein